MILFSPLNVLLGVVVLINFVVSRDPLVNNQGRFKFVDNIQTITSNQTILPDTHQLVRRDSVGFPYCRGKCSGANLRVGEALRRRSLENDPEGYIRSTWRVIKTSLQKRRFNPPSFLDWDELQMVRWMLDQFRMRGFLYVFEPNRVPFNGIHRDENTALYRPLDTVPFNMGVKGLCGCTILVIVSTEAVYFAHFFESLSWSPDEDILRDRGFPSLETNFQLSVINFLSTGRDWPDGEVDQNERLADHATSFLPELGTRAFILTPQNQADAAVASDTDVNGNVNYIDGLLYQDMVDQLIVSVNDLIGVNASAFSYQAIDGTDRRHDTTARGRALFQYDHRATRGTPPNRGSRLIFQGIDIDVTLDGQRVVFPKGVVYEASWPPPEDRSDLGEDRLLSDNPVQQESDSPSICGGQTYKSSNYTCYGEQLCPLLDGVPTLLCGMQCYLESLYTCWDSFLCPVIDGVPTLRCGEDCYLPSQYSCESSHLVQILSPDDDPENPHQSGDPQQSDSQVTTGTFSTATRSESQGIEVVFDGTIYTIATQLATFTNNGVPVIIGPGGLTIGSDIIPLPVLTGKPTAFTTDGVIFTVWPPGHRVTPTVVPSTTAAPGPLPTSVTPSPTITKTQTSTQVPTITVITITAIDSSSTSEVTFTASTLAPFTTLTSTSTITTTIDGVLTTIIVGPGGMAWIPTHPSTSTSGFPPVPFPSQPPSPGSTGTNILPTETSNSASVSPISTTTSDPFPSSQFTVPVVITTTITTDGPDGPTTSTITATTDSSGFVIPVTTMLTSAAIESAISLSSRLMSASSVINAFSANPVDAASSSSAVTAIETSKTDGNSFGVGLGISLPGLCLIFCGSAGGTAKTLQDLAGIIPSVFGGTSPPSAIDGPLTELASLADALGKEAEKASHSSETTAAPSCTGTVLTNCDVFCLGGTTSTAGSTITTKSCYSTTCSVDTQCGGSAVTSTSYEYLYCPTAVAEETMSLYFYPGFMFDPITTDFGNDPSSTETATSSDIITSGFSTTSESTTTSTSTTASAMTTTSTTTSTSSPSASPTSAPPDYVSNCNSFSHSGPNDGETCASFAETFDITVQQLFDWNYSLQPADGSKTCDLSTAWARGTQFFCIGLRDDSTTFTTSTAPQPAPTATRCDTYRDCPRCEEGSYRCCFSGCSGMVVPGSNYCTCYKDGTTPGSTCGCK